MVVSFCAILSIIACNCAGCFTTDKIKDDFYQQAQGQKNNNDNPKWSNVHPQMRKRSADYRFAV